jgi:hypothetical protein
MLCTVVMAIGGTVWIASSKVGMAEQSQKEIAGLRADMKEGFDDIKRQINGIPDERAKVRALEGRAAETRDDLGKHEIRIRALEDTSLRFKSDLDNLRAAMPGGTGRVTRP